LGGEDWECGGGGCWWLGLLLCLGWTCPWCCLLGTAVWIRRRGRLLLWLRLRLRNCRGALAGLGCIAVDLSFESVLWCRQTVLRGLFKAVRQARHRRLQHRNLHTATRLQRAIGIESNNMASPIRARAPLHRFGGERFLTIILVENEEGVEIGPRTPPNWHASFGLE
jgi:hypothetical protein